MNQPRSGPGILLNITPPSLSFVMRTIFGFTTDLVNTKESVLVMGKSFELKISEQSSCYLMNIYGSTSVTGLYHLPPIYFLIVKV